MQKDYIIGIGVWALVFALSIFLLLVIPSQYTNSIFVTLGFDVFAFFSTLILWFIIFRSSDEPNDMAYHSPTMTVSAVYLIAQLILCAVAGALGEHFSFKVILTVNFILLIIMWALILSTLIINNHSKRVDSRQKDHHTVL